MNAGFIAAAIICPVCVLGWMIKSEKGGKCFILSAFQGVAAMFAVNIAGLVTGVTLSVNWYTILTSALMGIPGVIGMLTLNGIL